MDSLYLHSWAFQLHREKGHILGNAYLDSDGVMRINMDGIPRTVGDEGELVAMATLYPEWPDRRRTHLEHLKSLQN